MTWNVGEIEFNQQSIEKKKEILILIMEPLGSSNEVFPRLVTQIKTNPSISDEFLVGIYHEVMEYGRFLEEHGKEVANSNVQKLQAKLESLRRQEELEREQENPEALLDQI